MIIKTENLSRAIPFPCCLDVPPDQILLFDIETTGFSPSSTTLYLIGAAVFKNGDWTLKQWMAEAPEEEILLLKAFHKFSASYSTLLHFNGDTFDLPYLYQKAKKYGLPEFLKSKKSRDLLRMLRPVKKLLGLTHMNQTALEAYLKLPRKDSYTGKELIQVYQAYVKKQDSELERLLLLHNHDDLAGMAGLLPMLSYAGLWEGHFQAEGCTLEKEDGSSFSLIFHLNLVHPVPKPLSRKLQFGYLHAEGSRARLLVHGIKGTLLHFFPNYQDYYYLPYEDQAVHKSVGIYADRENRVPAKASTCYCKKTGAFLPCPKDGPALTFKRACSDSQCYMECTPEFLQSLSVIRNYALTFLHFAL